MSTFKDLQSWASHVKDEWETPDHVFEAMNTLFKFELDVCASHTNHKLKPYYDKSVNGLVAPWAKVNWMNPPYSDITPWVSKARVELMSCDNITVALLPMCSDTEWFHNHVFGYARLSLIKGRLRFKGAPSSARFSSVIAVYHPEVNPHELHAIEFPKQQPNKPT